MANSIRFNRQIYALAIGALLAGTTAHAQVPPAHQGYTNQPIAVQPYVVNAQAQPSIQLQQPVIPTVQTPPATAGASLSSYQAMTQAPTPRHYVSPLARRAAVPIQTMTAAPNVHQPAVVGMPIQSMQRQSMHPAAQQPMMARPSMNAPPVAGQPFQVPATHLPAKAISGHSLFGPSAISPSVAPNNTGRIHASAISYNQGVPASTLTYTPATPQQVFSTASSCNCNSSAPATVAPMVTAPMQQPLYAPQGDSICQPACPTPACGCDAGLFGFPNELLPCLKNSPNGNLLASVGGEFRYRFMDEANRLRPPGPGSSQYNLWRFAPWMSINAGERVTLYGQLIDAEARSYDLPYTPLGIDVNRGDLLQAYVDINIAGGLNYRYGRQFLEYGSQRLVSPLAWANTYRNFEGHRLYYSGSTWDIDLFNMRTVNAAAGNAFRPTSFDTANANRQLSGLYTTYHGTPNRTWDFYWLWFDGIRSANLQDGDRHTIGLRWAGNQPICGACGPTASDWHWDFEGAYQFGEDDFGGVADADVHAGFLALSGGRKFGGLPWTPSVDGIFYYGSGDGNPNDDTINTVYTLFPLGHAYWGLIDQFSGQNLLNFGLQSTWHPAKRLTLGLATHWFSRANNDDAVYTITGAPIAAGTPGNYIGSEIDLTARLKVSDALSFEIGQFWFIYGDAINNSTPRSNARQFYFQSTLTF